MVQSCSWHLKTCESIENRKSKIFANPILSFYVRIEESKKTNRTGQQIDVSHSDHLRPKVKMSHIASHRKLSIHRRHKREQHPSQSKQKKKNKKKIAKSIFFHLPLFLFSHSYEIRSWTEIGKKNGFVFDFLYLVCSLFFFVIWALASGVVTSSGHWGERGDGERDLIESVRRSKAEKSIRSEMTIPLGWGWTDPESRNDTKRRWPGNIRIYEIFPL